MDSKSESSKLISSKAAIVDPERETDGIIWCFGFLYGERGKKGLKSDYVVSEKNFINFYLSSDEYIRTSHLAYSLLVHNSPASISSSITCMHILIFEMFMFKVRPKIFFLTGLQ